MQETVNGILVLYDRPFESNAQTIIEHVEAFERHSRFPVWSFNTRGGFPATLNAFRFSVVVLHYTLFAPESYHFDKYFRRYVKDTGSYKVAFFQDEHHYCQDRFAFLDDYSVDCVYTLVEPEQWPYVYGKYTRVPKLVTGIPGYVSDDLVQLAERIAKPDEERSIDVGYRGRTLKPYMGKGSQEKAEIGTGFLERARDSGLTLDIAVDEDSRIYGDAWFEFLADCRAVLGTEAGVSIFDTEDVVRTEYERLIADEPSLSFEELSHRLLAAWEDNIYYRTVSPRHFEAAAVRVCQILFEGDYSGILKPMLHYIPLKKDFSNLDEVLSRFRDPDVRRRLTENAYRDLIESGAYSYATFVEGFDAELAAVGLELAVDDRLGRRVTDAIVRGQRRRRRAAHVKAVVGRVGLVSGLQPLVARASRRYTNWKYRRFEKHVAADADS